ncbi:MAG: lysylphosphatidylglycerol synthase transmembrane domain-containing protein [Acidimicrobiia bacterium]|nr:lysylphosphatidylglycerol synthase transmembrane domain-containing protein [Acidimicrobiia bacterium]
MTASDEEGRVPPEPAPESAAVPVWPDSIPRPAGGTIEVPEKPKLNTRTILKIALRIGIAVAAIAISTFVLFGIFEDLNFEEIRGALAELSDAEWLALFFGWLIWIGAQGLQTASLVTAMPARRGVLAFLGPSAVSSVIPGPSDLPVRYSMYQSWGISSSDAATAVAASGVFSVGSQLALPAFAGVAIFFGGVQVDGFMTIIVAATLVLAVAIVLSAVVLGSDKRTLWAGRKLDRVWRRAMRLARKDPPEEALDVILERGRSTAFDYLSDKWLPTTGATLLTIGAKCSLLIMSLRFVGIPEDVLGWAAIFAVFALVAGITIIPITPGSAGVAEIALVGMLAPIAGSDYVNEVAAGVLLYRLLTWILVIFAGLLALGVWQYGQRRGQGKPSRRTVGA